MKTIRFAGLAALTVLLAAPLGAKQVQVNVEMANPFLTSDVRQNTFLKVGLTGFEMENKDQRTPANVCLVLDKSGSMRGNKIQQARIAAKQAIDRLGKQDIVSVVAYDDNVHVLVPATKVSDKSMLKAKIDELTAGGHTALFAGVSKGAEEIRKFIDKNRVNRVILLSDGLANVGPSGPTELGELGKELGKEGISVTTLGLGSDYNEDLMGRLASASDGNHVFVKDEEQLTKIFDLEFGDVLSVVAQEIDIKITTKPGIKPLRVLGRDAEIAGNVVRVYMNQLVSSQEKFVMIEVDVPAGKADTVREIADIQVAYANMETRTKDELANKVSVRFTASKEEVVKHANPEVYSSGVTFVANINTKLGCALRDQGKTDEAAKVFRANDLYIADSMKVCPPAHQELNKYRLFNSKNLDYANESNSAWNLRKKQVVDEVQAAEQQRSY